MLKLSLKQTIVAIVLIAALLSVMVGGILRIEVTRSAPTLSHSSHTLAWYCPAPPIVC